MRTLGLFRRWFELQQIANVTVQVETQSGNGAGGVFGQGVIGEPTHGVFIQLGITRNRTKADSSPKLLLFLGEQERKLTAHDFHAS